MQKAHHECCQNRYRKICLVLDDDTENESCTDTEFGFEGEKESRFIKWETPKKVARKIYLYFRDDRHANIADLKIVYSSIDTEDVSETEPFRIQDCTSPNAPCHKAIESDYLVAENPWRRLFYKFYKHPIPYPYAKAQCQSDGTNLAIPRSAAENDFLSSIVTSCCPVGGAHHMWLGIDDIEEDGNHKTVDGSDLTFTNWEAGILAKSNNELIRGIPRAYSNRDGHENAMMVFHDRGQPTRDGFWVVIKNWAMKFICTETENFMTEKRVKKPTEDYSVAENPWGRSYYKIYLDPMTFPEAQAQCKSDGANLAIPRSKIENNFIASLIPDKRIWIGINDIESEGNFVTVDGSGWVFYLHFYALCSQKL